MTPPGSGMFGYPDHSWTPSPNPTMTRSLPIRRISAPLLVSLLLAACGGDGTTSPPPPASVGSVTVNPPTVALDPQETSQLSATPRDANGTALSGRTISWSTSASGVATVTSAGLVTAVSPGEATITATSEGRSGSAVITVNASPNPLPVLTEIAPSEAQAGGPAFTLVMKGQGFVEGAQVRWGGAARPTTFVSATELSAEIPASDIAGPGTIPVTVVNPAPGGGASSSLPFAIVALPPPPGSLSVSEVHACGIDSTGAAWCWGLNDMGRLGNGTRESSNVPVAVAGGHRFAYISAGIWHTCALTAEGVAWCWGRGLNGQLGTGSLTDSLVPVQVNTSVRFASIETGGLHTCGLTQDGTVYCWGSGANGRLGNGSVANVPALLPAPMSGYTFSALSARGAYTCGIAPAQTAWCWGWGGAGQLGNGSTQEHALPVAVAGGMSFSFIQASIFQHTCGITTEGAAYCWGIGANGRLGQGSTEASETPVKVAGDHVFSSLSAGLAGGCALTAAGEAWCWGAGGAGQLGSGSNAASLVPVPVAGGHRFTVVGSGAAFSCALDLTRKAYCWGSAVDGKLGNGGTVNSNVPVPVAGNLTFGVDP